VYLCPSTPVCDVVLYIAPLYFSMGEPPAMPHGSDTGARPGARHGFHRQMSCRLPSVAFWFVLQYLRSSVPWRSAVPASRSAGHWSQFGIREPLVVQRLQPMLQPCENQ